jgi:hypothetical protein
MCSGYGSHCVNHGQGHASGLTTLKSGHSLSGSLSDSCVRWFAENSAGIAIHLIRWPPRKAQQQQFSRLADKQKEACDERAAKGVNRGNAS